MIKKKYKIIITNNNKEVEFIGNFSDKKKGYKVYNSIIDNNQLIKFPLIFNNTNKKIQKAKYEVLLLELKDEDSKISMLPNNIGKIVEHIINNNDKWGILDKHFILKEESFWYYGYHPKHDRKNVDFIINNIKKEINEIYIYNNKIIIRSINDIDLICCKCCNDAIRLMKYIQINTSKKDNIFYYNLTTKTKSNIINLIKDKTGWDKKKIWRKSTRP